MNPSDAGPLIIVVGFLTAGLATSLRPRPARVAVVLGVATLVGLWMLVRLGGAGSVDVTLSTTLLGICVCILISQVARRRPHPRQDPGS